MEAKVEVWKILSQKDKVVNCKDHVTGRSCDYSITRVLLHYRFFCSILTSLFWFDLIVYYSIKAIIILITLY